MKFLARILSLILRFFLGGGGQIFFPLWDHLFVSIAFFKHFFFCRYLKNYYKYWLPYAHALTFMRTLSVLMRTLSIHICQMFSLYTISIHIRNWCMHWVCVSGTDDCSEHTIRSWCVRWAFASRTITLSLSVVPSKNSEHTRQEQKHTVRY
jgi:hypothetical protein